MYLLKVLLENHYDILSLLFVGGGGEGAIIFIKMFTLVFLIFVGWVKVHNGAAKDTVWQEHISR